MIRPKLRIATNDDADYIREILDLNGQIPNGHDWSDIGQNWIVAEYDDTIIGTVQVLPGKPFGHIGFLAILPGYYNGGAGALLWWAAEKLLADLDCDGYTGMSSNPQVLKKFARSGGVVFDNDEDTPPVKVLFKRVYRGKNGRKENHD